jgi:hypothetical protein
MQFYMPSAASSDDIYSSHHLDARNRFFIHFPIVLTDSTALCIRKEAGGSEGIRTRYFQTISAFESQYRSGAAALVKGSDCIRFGRLFFGMIRYELFLAQKRISTASCTTTFLHRSQSKIGVKVFLHFQYCKQCLKDFGFFFVQQRPFR